MINKIAVAITLLLALLIGVLMWAAFHYYGKSTADSVTITQKNSDLTLQTTVIAKQSLDFQKFNDIAAAASQNDAKVAATVEVKEIEYRTILRKEPTCALNVPASISDGLYDYANRLRSSAINADPSGTNSTNSNAIATGTLTYCQAVLWITPLLSAIETANNHLAAIRKIEVQRQK